MAAEAPRRRPRRGSLERPVSTRIYRAAWLVVAVPLLVAAFSVGEPDPLPEPRLRPFFDQSTAVQFSKELASTFPDRSPGSLGAAGAADWVDAQLRQYGFTIERQTFTVDIPGRGQEELVNIVAVAPRTGGQGVQSQRAIAVLAHRDNLGASPGAVDNGSGTGALLELARDLGNATLSHPFILVSTDGGALGGLGAAHFAETAPYAGRLAAVVNLVGVGGRPSPRIEFGGDTPRVSSAKLVATAEAAIRAEADVAPTHPGAFAQLVDLAFPFSFYEQAPFVSRGVPAITITTGTSRPRPPEGDSARRPERRAARRARARLTVAPRLPRRGRRGHERHPVLHLLRDPHPLRLDAAVRPHRSAPALPGGDRRPLRPLPAPAHLAPSSAAQLSQPAERLALARRGVRGLRRSRTASERRRPAPGTGHRGGGRLARGRAGGAGGRLRRRMADREAAARADPLHRPARGAGRPPRRDARPRSRVARRRRAQPLLADLLAPVAPRLALATAAQRPRANRPGGRLRARIPRPGDPARLVRLPLRHGLRRASGT